MDEAIVRFSDVSFGFGHNKPILHEASFSLRRGSKITLMGQNGAGKTTIFQLITKNLKPETGSITTVPKLTIAISKQIMSHADLELTVREFFAKVFPKKVYDLDPRIEEVLEVVHLVAPFDKLKASPLDKKVESFSGGQKARLLLASALIQDPDLLLLDEPTNNLDKDGIAHLRDFLINYPKTCIVISHDAPFLNSFTQGVLYLDIFTKQIEQYNGNYFSVVAEISKRIERERMQNVRLEKDISHRKEQADFFAQKGGHLRDVARKMREKIDDLEEEKVETRREDKTIRAFTIPSQQDATGVIASLKSVSLLKNHKLIKKKVSLDLRKKEHLLLSGPNGIGKTTLLESIVNRTAEGVTVPEHVVIGYFRQDFRTFDFNQTAYESLSGVVINMSEEEMRSVAAGFLLNSQILKTKIGDLSEGQKGLLSFARIVLQKPGLLILDEPTNHINFRHIPVIAEALDKYDGALILVSHVPEFVRKIRIDQTLDLDVTHS